MNTEGLESWVVYKMTLRGIATQMNAVCSQGKWDAMEQARPGYHTLVRGGISTESEAERMARGEVPPVNRRRYS
jgi:hypothetical protein